MTPGETLKQCLAREVHEETGLDVQVGDLLAVSEYRNGSGEHKIECFFAATLLDSPRAESSWQDSGGPVTSFGLFSDADLATMDARPAFVMTIDPEQARPVPVYLPGTS